MTPADFIRTWGDSTLRERQGAQGLSPPDLVRIEPEVAPGYPDRVLPRDAAAAADLKKPTLINLYNARPAWLAMAHRRLDAAVAAAYGWPADLPDDAVLERLSALNQESGAAGRLTKCRLGTRTAAAPYDPSMVD